ncbi:MAG: HlyD family efflux transporter periplasmic adaptor subunit [Paracraurococcus sp.]
MTILLKQALVQPPAPPPAETRDAAPLGDEAELWSGFAGARSAGEFCQTWLALQCRDIPGAAAGLLLLHEGNGRYTPAGIWPDRTRDVSHLAKAAQDALGQRSGLLLGGPDAAQAAYPIEAGGTLHGVVVVEVRGQPPAAMAGVLRRLHWGAGWLETLIRRRNAEQDEARIGRIGLSLDVLAAAAEHPRQREAGTAVATLLAARLGCSRVSLGLARGGGVRLEAMSHQASFQERASIVDTIENAMEEALDQDAAVAHPPAPGTMRRIALAQAELARLSGARAVASVPLASAGRPVGVLTLERDDDTAFDDEALAQLAAVAVTLGPLVEARAQSQRLVAGSLVDGAGSGLRALFGPRRPGLKLGAVLGLAALSWLAMATGEFRVSARTVIEGTVQRAAVAPFEGFVAAAPARAGDTVAAGQVLASLDDRELALEAARWRAEREQSQLKYQEALGKQDRAQARILAAQLRQAEAQLALVENKLGRAVIRAPFAGLIVSGDLSQTLGAPVETGKLLFEIAPLDGFRAVLQVEERDLAYLRNGQAGLLRLAGRASDPVPVRVTKVTPVATATDGRNTFRVEAELAEIPGWVRPGMEGVAKIGIEERLWVWVWTRSLVDWARLAVWSWWP